MRKHSLFICVCLTACIILICSCSSYEKNKFPCYAEFPEEISLVHTFEMKSDTIFFRYPYRIEIKDSLAVVLDLHPDSCFLHAFTYPAWNYISSFGKRGEGPEDMLSAERVRICSSDSVWVLDANRGQISRWCISFSQCTAERMEDISLDNHLLRTLDFCKTSDGFLVTDYTGKYRYHVLDSKGRIKQSQGRIPTKKNVNDAENTALAQAWRSFMDYNPDSGILAMVSQLGEVIEVFNLKTGMHHVGYGPGGEPVFSTYEGEAMPKGIKGFNEVVVSDTCIYAVFDGTSFKDRIHAFYSGTKFLEGGRCIYMFDLQGNPVRKLFLTFSAFGMEVLEKGLFITSTDTDIPLHFFSMKN